jgi:hypothetical protein
VVKKVQPEGCTTDRADVVKSSAAVPRWLENFFAGADEAPAKNFGVLND